MRTNKATAKKTDAEKAARRARTASLKEATVDTLKAEAKQKGLQVGGTKAELVARIVRAEFSPAKREKLTLTEARAKLAAKKKQKRVWQGRGPFRLLVLTAEGGVTANLGPYAAARGAQADAKTLLRRMVGDGPMLSHTAAEEQMPELADEFKKTTGGTVVDGWVALSKSEDPDEDGEELASAWIIKFTKNDDKAFAGGKTPKALRNPLVTFNTRKGPVSFEAKGTRSRTNGASSKLTVLPSSLEPGTYNYFQWTPESEKSITIGTVHAIYGVPYPALSFREALQVAETAGLFTRVYTKTNRDSIPALNARAAAAAQYRRRERDMMYAEMQRRAHGPVQRRELDRFAQQRERALEGIRALGVRVNGAAIHLTDAQSREVDSLYQQGHRAVDRLTARDQSAFIHWQDILIYAVGNDYRVDRFLRAVEMGDPDGLFVDDRAKGRTVHASARRKVTWADFTKAVNALRRAMR